MAVIKPFKAVRPGRKYADRVIALPYDVMDREEAAEMAEGNPYSFLHISRSEIDLPDAFEHTKEVYDKAKSNLEEFIADGILVRDEKEMIYVYREIMDERVQTGIFACASVDDYLENRIRKHELTRIEKEDDRTNHFDICDADTEPVYLTHREDKKLRRIIESWADNHMPEYNVKDRNGVRHLLWPVDDSDVVKEVVRRYREIPVMYIADGHHRSASSVRVAQKRREENPEYTGTEEFNYFLAAIFPENDLHVFDYNRVVKDLADLRTDEFIKAVKKAGFTVDEAGDKPYRPEKKGVFGMYLDDKWYRIEASKDIIPDDVIKSLDVAVLQDNILEPILGIEDPRTSDRIDFIGGIRGLTELERRVHKDMRVAFSVYPVTVTELMDVADAGKTMPPKSTWFEPKLASGLVIHTL